jgi:hypothetical protein
LSRQAAACHSRLLDSWLLMEAVNACYRPTPVIPGIPVNFLKAATPDLPHTAIVHLLSARSRRSMLS